MTDVAVTEIVDRDSDGRIVAIRVSSPKGYWWWVQPPDQPFWSAPAIKDARDNLRRFASGDR